MTVQELIDELMKIEDKSKKVFVFSYDEEKPPSDVIEDGNDMPKDSVLII